VAELAETTRQVQGALRSKNLIGEETMGSRSSRIERALAAIAHCEPDKVPKGELNIHLELIDKLAPGLPGEFQRDLAARERLHMDLVCFDAEWPERESVGSDDRGRPVQRDAWGTEVVCGEKSHIVTRPAAPTIDDARRLKAPDLSLFGFDRTRRWSSETDFYVFGITGGCYDTAVWLVGLENCAVWSLTEPEVLAGVMDVVADFHIRVAERLLDAGAHGIIVADDIAYNSGTFLRPEALRRFVFPRYSEMLSSIRARSPVPIFLHSDGNLNRVLADVVEIGFDGLHSLQPSAGMDIGAIKAEWGDRLCLMGNIDQDSVLPFGPPERVARVVEETIRAAAPGGGYILSSTNTLVRELPLENVLAMYDTAEKVGREVYSGAR
jgi:uroporphyrinogen decarboxylase